MQDVRADAKPQRKCPPALRAAQLDLAHPQTVDHASLVVQELELRIAAGAGCGTRFDVHKGARCHLPSSLGRATWLLSEGSEASFEQLVELPLAGSPLSSRPAYHALAHAEDQ